MPLHVSSTSAHHQEVKIALHSQWHHHTYRWPSRPQPVHERATYRCDDTRCSVMQFWPPDDEHICWKHVEAWNKLIVKQNCCASSWLITQINLVCSHRTDPARPIKKKKTFKLHNEVCRQTDRNSLLFTFYLYILSTRIAQSAQSHYLTYHSCSIAYNLSSKA